MDLPISLIGTSIEENKIYYFTSKAPIGIPEHMHVCIRIKGQMLLFCCRSGNKGFVRIGDC